MVDKWYIMRLEKRREKGRKNKVRIKTFKIKIKGIEKEVVKIEYPFTSYKPSLFIKKGNKLERPTSYERQLIYKEARKRKGEYDPFKKNEEKREIKRMELKIVCNRCNKEYPITELSNLDYARIINVKTGGSLQKGMEIGTYRVMDIKRLPCGCTDSHWVFITNENKIKEVN